MSDLISRQAALESIWAMKEHSWIQSGYDLCLKVLTDLSSTEPENCEVYKHLGKDKKNIQKELNCPNCGAPIRGSKCEYCGTIFYDYSRINSVGR